MVKKGILFFVCLAVLASVSYGQDKHMEEPSPLFPIKQNDKYGYIDKTGKIVIKPKFDNVWIFSEGLASVEIDLKYGYIDKTGKIVIKPKFDNAYIFSEGLACVEIDDKEGYINKTGNYVWKPTK